ncbi:MAG: hypothetical protein SP4CHLAM5_03320 [Chlamydiia bacterium]|nr:hypothetical protein [Chlamydiia bacterium]MCH9618206.1 hypothetical protein [Chlamydiia bacterium]MCH9624071.1 hypothetical protein [Chlamydiia bacterium]
MSGEISSAGTTPPERTNNAGDGGLGTPSTKKMVACGVIVSITLLAAYWISNVAASITSYVSFSAICIAGFALCVHIGTNETELESLQSLIVDNCNKIVNWIASSSLFNRFTGDTD